MGYSPSSVELDEVLAANPPTLTGFFCFVSTSGTFFEAHTAVDAPIAISGRRSR